LRVDERALAPLTTQVFRKRDVLDEIFSFVGLYVHRKAVSLLRIAFSETKMFRRAAALHMLKVRPWLGMRILNGPAHQSRPTLRQEYMPQQLLVKYLPAEINDVDPEECEAAYRRCMWVEPPSEHYERTSAFMRGCDSWCREAERCFERHRQWIEGLPKVNYSPPIQVRERCPDIQVSPSCGRLPRAWDGLVCRRTVCPGSLLSRCTSCQGIPGGLASR
jgi:hypothetical protein